MSAYDFAVVGAPSGSLAWNATLAALALEKLLQGREVSDRERSAIESVSNELASLSRVGKIPIGSVVRGESDRLTSGLRQSFFTLVALEESISHSIDVSSFEQLGLDMSSILTSLNTSTESVARDIFDKIERAQSGCFDLLERLAGRSPQEAP